MCFRKVTAAVVLVSLAALSPVLAYGAAQLAAGAKTSAQPTSTNPSIRQMQLTFDPDVELPGAVTGGPYNVTDFQLSIQFDPTKVHVAGPSDVQFVGPYTETPLSESGPSLVDPLSASPANTPASNVQIDNVNGFVHFISGFAPVGQTQGGDVNIFLINFMLNGSTSLNDPLTFTIFGDPTRNDFIAGTNPNNPQDTAFTPAAGIIPTTITGSFNQFAAQIAAAAAASAPLPAALGWPAIVAVALVAASASRLRRGAVAR
jgi:hypothetical protein